MKPIYFDSNVMITDDLATISGDSYPVRAISPIRIRRREAASGVFQFLTIIAGGVIGLFGAIAFYGLNHEEFMYPDFTVCLFFVSIGVLLIIGIALLKRGAPVFFDLILVTNAREGVVMTSEDRDYIQHVRAALEQAILGTEHESARKPSHGKPQSSFNQISRDHA